MTMQISLLKIAFLLLPLTTYNAECSGHEVFDVTSFGAVSGGNDSAKAFLAAWDAACKFEGKASFLIPNGTFLIGPITFGGPCFHNSSPSVDMKGKLEAVPSRKDLSEDSWILFQYLNGLSLSGGGTLHGQGALAWKLNTCSHQRSCQMLPTMLSFDSVENSAVSSISLVDSKAFHIKFHRCKHIHVSGINISSPAESPNTDGIHLGISDHINITSSIIGAGDDCISIGPGSTNIFISKITCGPGHGISVGSLGKKEDELDVIGLHVKNCTIKNTDNGVRIKTWPGSPASSANNFTFEDIVMVNVSNPILIDQKYCPLHDCTDKPSQVEISNVMFKKIRGTSETKVAINLLCSEKVPCKNVQLLDVNLSCSAQNCATTSACSNVDGNFSGIQVPDPCLPGNSTFELNAFQGL